MNKKKRRKQKKSCQSKVKHKSWKVARMSMKRTLEQNFIFHEMKVYHCKFCGFWHIGRTKGIQYEKFGDLVK